MTEHSHCPVRCVAVLVTPLGAINFKKIRELAKIPLGQDIFPYILSHYKGEEYQRAMEVVETEELLAQRNLALQPGGVLGVSLIIGVNELLSLLNERGVKVALLTRNSQKSMNNVLNLIAAKVDVAYSREIQPSKPNIDPFVRISKDLGVPCENMLLAGDHVDDFIASIGAYTVWAVTRSHSFQVVLRSSPLQQERSGHFSRPRAAKQGRTLAHELSAGSGLCGRVQKDPFALYSRYGGRRDIGATRCLEARFRLRRRVC